MFAWPLSCTNWCSLTLRDRLFAITAGDMVHSPLQVRYPDLVMFVDYDRAQGVATRQSLFSKLCDTLTLLCPAHFPSPSRGTLTRWGEGFRYNPV